MMMTECLNVLTVGDALITMNPVSNGPLRYVTHFERKVGGADLNFAVGVARLGLSSKWVSRLGNDDFGKVIYNFARGEGVDVSEVKFVDGHATSVNFKEIREDGSGKTFYHRSNSPILSLTPEDITDEMFQSIDLVHLSGVFLSIDKKNLLIAKTIIEKAKENDITISFDPNIRLKLWTIEEARDTFKEIFPHVDLLLTGLDEIKLVIGDDSKKALAEFAHQYQIKDLVIKDGGNGSMLYRNGAWTEQEVFDVHVVDTVGAGDGFDAGYVYGYLHQYEASELLTFANGVGALVTTVSGDTEGLPYLDEVNALVRREQVIER